MIGQVNTQERDGKIVITIDPDPKGVLSRSGKSKVHASTQGFISAGDYQLNLNLIRKGG